MDETSAPVATESPTAAAPSASETAAPPAASEASTTPAPPAAPIANATQEPAPAVTPETPAPISTTAPSATSTEPTSLLGEAAKPAPEPTAEAKPDAATGDKSPTDAASADAKPDGEAPAPEAPPVEAPLPTYDVFTVPEGVELEDQQVDQFVGTLGSFERSILAEKDPAIVHAKVQQFGQQMLDQYTEEVAQLGERVRQANAETFARTMENWKNEFFNDPEIGGNRKDTTLKNVGAVVNRFGGNPQQIAELRSIFSTTGAGNHRLVLGLFNNIAGFLGEGRAVGAEKPEPQTAPRKERRYGKGH